MKHVPSIRELKAIRQTRDGRLQAAVICTDEKQTRASGHVLLADGKKVRCNWLPSGKCLHDDSGRFDLDFASYAHTIG